MKNYSPISHLQELLLVIGIVTLLQIPSCKPGQPNEEMILLMEKQAFLASQRDSLQRLLEQKNIQYDTVYTRYNDLNEDLEALKNKNKSIQSGYSKRGEELKKETARNAELTQAVNAKNAENDSILKELAILQHKATETEAQKVMAEKSNAELVLAVEAKDQKIAADSIAEANKPIPPKETGFISITEIGAGVGMGDTNADYARSIISINTVAGYRINNHFTAGLGLGFNIYNGGNLIPLYLDFRYRFNEGKITPFFIADGGVMLDPSSSSGSGLFVNPAFGVSKKLNKTVAFHLSAGILVQESPGGPRNSFFNFKGGVAFLGK